MTTLDDWCHERRVAVVDFIKCDVEGAEVGVLRGARSLLKSENPPIWMIEVIDPFLDEVAQSADDLLREFHDGQTTIRLYSQTDRGEPVQIERLADRLHSNNVFVVPSTRDEQFERAVSAINCGSPGASTG
jgi:hypothetical protein